MEFGVLGPLEVRTPTAIIEIRRGLPRMILTYLVLRPGEIVTSGALADALWGDDQPVNPANALQTQISYLRKRFAAHVAVQPIVTRPGGYSLEVDRASVDAHCFEQVVRSVSRSEQHGPGDHAEALGLLDDALSWWRGPALADVIGEPFAVGEAARLEELRLTALEVRHDLALELGQHREIVGDVSALVTEHPLREKLHEQLMLALYRSGRQADALRAFEGARQILVDQLGIDPGPDLRDLERRILAHDPALAFIHPPVAAAQADSSPTRVSPSGEPRVRRRASLPAILTQLVGREVEIDRVRQLLTRGRLVTLTGPAGAGKSRLAIETARLLAHESEVWFVDLGDIDESRHVATAVAAALDVPTIPGEDAIDAVTSAVSAQRGVLVLDTCEHVVGAVALLVGRILRDAPDVRVLATSRRPLNVSGEVAWPVPPLALAPLDADSASRLTDFPAVELFVQRAVAVRPDFELSPEVAPHVAAICMSLDGLPLAIELAAARIDVLSPGAIRERLTSRFDLLVDGGRDTTARQQTLRGAIDWSIGLLDEPQRLFFARLGVFAGTFDLDAATCVGAVGDADALDLLTALVRHSMVTVVGGDRYRLLDTLRAYALDMLEHLDADDTRARHAGCYLALAERAERGIQGPDQIEWLTRLRQDLPNHRAVLEWMVSTGDSVGAATLAGALGWFWTLDGMLADACLQLERVLEFPDLPDRERSKVLWSLALVVASAGQLERARSLATEGVELGRRVGDPVQTGYSFNALAVAEWALGDLARSRASRDSAIELFDAASEAWGGAVCRVLLARTAVDERDESSAELVAESLDAARGTGDRHLIGIAVELTARLALQHGDIETGVRAAREALDLHAEIGYTEGAIAAHHLLGRGLLAAGQHDVALSHHVQALRSAVAIGHRAAVCEAIEDVARIHLSVGERDDAERLFRVADAERERCRVPRRTDDDVQARAVGDVAEGSADNRARGGLEENIDQVISTLMALDHASI